MWTKKNEKNSVVLELFQWGSVDQRPELTIISEALTDLRILNQFSRNKIIQPGIKIKEYMWDMRVKNIKEVIPQDLITFEIWGRAWILKWFWEFLTNNHPNWYLC